MGSLAVLTAGKDLVDALAGGVDQLEHGLVEHRVVPGQDVVAQLGHAALVLALAGQGLAQLHFAARHVSLGQAGGELPGRDGEKVRVVGRVGLIQAAEHLIDSGGQVVGGGADGLPAAGLAQQVEEHAHRVHQQLFGQQGQYAAPHGVVLLIAQVIELLRGNGGAVPGEGAAQEKVGGDPIIVTGPDHEGQAGLPDAVLIVGQQGLGDAQGTRCGALADPPLLPQQGEGAGKFCIQISHLEGRPAGRRFWISSRSAIHTV